MVQFKYNVDMSCQSCSNAINKVLNKLEGADRTGVEKVDISLEKQTVLVDSKGPDYDKVLQTIQKTGRTVHGGETVA